MSRVTYEDFVKTLKQVPPVECSFCVGDTVTYTNEYGVTFPGMKIIGFAADESLNGRFIHLEKTAWWFPVKPGELTLEQKLYVVL